MKAQTKTKPKKPSAPREVQLIDAVERTEGWFYASQVRATIEEMLYIASLRPTVGRPWRLDSRIDHQTRIFRRVDET